MKLSGTIRDDELNYLTDVVLYQIFRTILDIYNQDNKSLTNKSPIQISVNKILNRITFNIKTGHYLELLTPGNMKLLGNTEAGKTKDKNGDNVPQLEITEEILVHCNVVHNQY